MLPGLLLAKYENWPLLSLAEAYGPEQTARMHKRLDHAGVVRPFVKAAATLGGPAIRELAALARAEIPGPVHVDLVKASSASLPAASPSTAGDAGPLLRRIESSKRPVVIAGGVAARRGWGARLRSLRVPVFTTVAAKGVVDERSPHAAGVFTGDGGVASPEASLLPAADLVVGLGLRTTEVLSVQPFAAPLVVLDAGPESTAGGWNAEHAAAGQQDEGFGRVLEALAGIAWGEEQVAAALARARSRLVGGEWLPGAVLGALEQLLPERAVLVLDTGMFCTVAEHVYRARSPRAFLASANGRHMGSALPMALGAAIAGPDPVVCCVGDGGLPPYLGEWRLALERRLDVLLLLMSDGGYGSIASAPGARGSRSALLEFPGRSWCRAIEGMGCHAARVSDLGGLQVETSAWLARGGPAFLELPFAPARYRTMLEGIR
jgi:acetolactate synthase-1/2/3 large subunit